MEDSLHIEVYRLLRDTTRHLKDELRKKIEDNGITWPQFHALFHIAPNGIPVNELAKELNCNASNMTGLVDRMTENGWVYREHSEEDRRVWLVKLTHEGETLKTRMLPIHNQNIHLRMSVLSNQELATLQKILKNLTDTKIKEEES